MPEEQTPAVQADEEAAPVLSAADIAAIRAENESLKGQVNEHQRNAQFWYQKAETAAARPGKSEAPPPEEEEEVDLLDLITTKGEKGLDALLEKRGFVRKADVDATVNQRARQMTDEAKLIRDYPELAKENSEFFKTTATHFGQLKQQGVPENMAMRLAAERAELEMMRAGKIQTPKEQAETAKQKREQDRQARAAAASGDRGGRTAADASEDDDELSAEQQQIAVRMLAVDGVTREQAIERYKARGKTGVAVKGGMGGPQRRAA